MMKRLVAFLFFAGLAALAVMLVAPGFIDWNRHKSVVISRIEPYFQRRIEVSGGMSLRLLPQPEIMLEGVSIANAKGGRAPSLLTLRQLGLRIRLAPLLNGRVEVESLDLVGPVLNLEASSGGKGNWNDVLAPSAVSALGSAAGGVELGRATVVDGEINAGRVKLSHLDLAIAADTLFGPYRVSGGMEWGGQKVKIGLATGRYDGTAPVQMQLDIIPDAKLPHLSFDGVLDMQAGFDAQGAFSLSQGTLAQLSGYDALSFLREPVDLTAVLEVKDTQVTLTDIKAKVGQKGDLRGKASVQFPPDARAVARLDLEGAGLTLMAADADPYLAGPEGFTASLSFKGRNVMWNGYKLASAALNADVTPQAWAVKSLQATLTDGSQVSASGTMTPGADSGSYTIGLSTPDAGKLAALLQPADNNIFKALADTGVVRKLALSSRLDVSPARVSLFSLDATAEDKMGVTGVINIDRTAPRPNITAKLDFTDWDVSTAEGFDAFVNAVRASDSDLELGARNLTLKSLHVASLAFSAKTGADGVEIRQAAGKLSDSESFSITGSLTASGADLSYKLKAAQAKETAAALGIALPPPLRGWRDADIAGTIKTAAAGSSFTLEGMADGGGVNVSGSVAAGHYKARVHLGNKSAAAGWAQLGLPVSALLGDAGAFDLTADFAGTADDYALSKVAVRSGAAQVSGTIARKSSAVTADLTAGEINLDKWLDDDWAVRQQVVLALRGDDFIYMGQHVANPQMTLQADAGSVKIPDLRGSLWEGPVAAALTLSRKGDGWTAAVKGRVEQADLRMLTNAMGLRGLSVTGATLDADVASADNTPAALTGTLGVHAGSVVVSGFSIGKVAERVNALTSVPPALDQMVTSLFRDNGATTFRDVSADLRVEDGKIKGDTLQLENPAGYLAVKAAAGFKGGDASLDGTLLLKNMPKLGGLHISRTGGGDYTIDTAPFLKYVTARNPGPVADAPDVQPVPEAMPAQEGAVPVAPAPAETGGVGGILDRLDKE